MNKYTFYITGMTGSTALGEVWETVEGYVYMAQLHGTKAGYLVHAGHRVKPISLHKYIKQLIPDCKGILVTPCYSRQVRQRYQKTIDKYLIVPINWESTATRLGVDFNYPGNIPVSIEQDYIQLSFDWRLE